MFVVIIEQRISAEVKEFSKSEKDWYALVALAVPFEARVGTEIFTKANKVIELVRVIYNPNNATFWAELGPILHPEPDAKTVAEVLVDKDGWDAAVEAGALKEATKKLRTQALRKLQMVLQQARSAMLGGPRARVVGPGGAPIF